MYAIRIDASRFMLNCRLASPFLRFVRNGAGHITIQLERRTSEEAENKLFFTLE